MKLFYSIIVLMLMTLAACNNAPERPAPILPENYEPAAPAAAPGAQPPTAAEAAQNADGVWHYICPNGHEGGAGSAVPCPVCGTALTHNSAYHNSSATTTKVGEFSDGKLTSTPNENVNIVSGGTEPPQNANGVWHYTCPQGCEGGAGSAGTCAKCGATLAHNSAYHQ